MSVASKSCARSRERGRRKVNIPTSPHSTPCERSIKILCKVDDGTWPKERSHPHPTPPHVSVASTSCAWSREHGGGNVHIPNPLHSTPPHPTPCKLWGKRWVLRLTILLPFNYIDMIANYILRYNIDHRSYSPIYLCPAAGTSETSLAAASKRSLRCNSSRTPWGGRKQINGGVQLMIRWYMVSIVSGYNCLYFTSAISVYYI